MRLITKAMLVTSMTAAVAVPLIACGDPNTSLPRLRLRLALIFRLPLRSAPAPRQASQQSLRTTPRMAA